MKVEYPEYLVDCTECGHEHFAGDGRFGHYIECPLRSEGCPCPYVAGSETGR